MAKQSSQFVPMSEMAEARPSIIGASQGEGGSGKSHLWLTGPEIIYYFLLEPGGLKGLRSNPLFRTKDVRVWDASGKLDFGAVGQEENARGERVKKALDVMNNFWEAWEEAQNNARTIIVDKEDLLWETLRYAHDEVESPEPKNFHELNIQYRALFTQCEAAGINFGLIRGLKDTWGVTGTKIVNGQKKNTMGFTGIMKPRGMKEVVELAQINLEHRWDSAERVFKTKILEKCRLGNAVELMGKEYTNLDFLTLGMELFPESDVSDWE